MDTIFQKYDYDFRMYHRDMIGRRLDIFMVKHEIKSIKDAIGIIVFNASAFKSFFLEISINVTEFFRKPLSLKKTDEAKNATYPLESLSDAKKNLAQMNISLNIEDYIIQNNHYFKISEKIKKKILLFQHNLVTDTSFNEFDIIICKNILIYFDENLQKKVFQLFYNSLCIGGFLVLGKSEDISQKFADKFHKCSDDCKIFKKVA